MPFNCPIPKRYFSQLLENIQNLQLIVGQLVDEKGQYYFVFSFQFFFLQRTNNSQKTMQFFRVLIGNGTFWRKKNDSHTYGTMWNFDDCTSLIIWCHIYTAQLRSKMDADLMLWYFYQLKLNSKINNVKDNTWSHFWTKTYFCKMGKIKENSCIIL